ncbi:MAG TPA: FAD-dependent monooxygenase [Rhizomicrobium sp.]|jgi:2-polyprenyl-6-methoxyphenol hydroxylase-like FAD-dependent oxidoreductase|nr:FAD-dependent monooxygenase [Rhizomicrobium sp.]
MNRIFPEPAHRFAVPAPVLIVGAGPTGLVLALWLTAMGVNVRIIDKAGQSGTSSRALALHARTLELYRQLDLAEEVVARGHHVSAATLWVAGRKIRRIVPKKTGEDLTPYARLQIFPQDEHERLLIDRLAALGVTVERNVELLDYREEGDEVVARLATPNGEEEWRGAYLMGADGARSSVRRIMGVGFPGGTYDQVFYVADVEGSGPAMDGELHADIDWTDPLGVFPLRRPLGGKGHARLIGTVADREGIESLSFADVAGRATRHMQITVERVNWFSVYRVHKRVAEHFRKGRAFLLGDAAHIHSPAGGQGMNTGIGDAVNLAWKIAAVLTGAADARLLDTYEAERIGFARQLLVTTDRMFGFMTSTGKLAEIVRVWLLPYVLPALASIRPFREWRFRSVSQIAVNYRGQALSEGGAGQVLGGDRLPWVGGGAGDGIGDVIGDVQGNHAPLAEIGWQVHVYGAADAKIAAWCRDNDVKLHVFAFTPAHAKAGLKRDALYLTRPDTYIALVSARPSAQELRRYFAEREIKPGSRDVRRTDSKRPADARGVGGSSRIYFGSPSF